MAAHVKHNAYAVPETVIVEGTSKRNILRKGVPAKGRKAGAATNVVDDGTTYRDPAAMDDEDPNYDSEAETEKEYMRNLKTCRSSVGLATMTLTAYKAALQNPIIEYFDSGDAHELLQSVQELQCHQYLYEFVKKLINMSLDKKDRERELVSQLLSVAYPHMLSSSCIGKGFERLFELSDELVKDAPTAKDMLATFLARAVIDEVLPPSFLADPVVGNLGGEIVDHAKVMLSRDHAGAKLERIWGPGDGRSVDEMKDAVDQLLLEYLASHQTAEAVRCVKQLNAPFFHHELVKRLIVISLEKPVENQKSMSALLQQLMEEDVVSRKQFVMGFDRTFSIMSDLVLDTPNARKLVQDFVERAQEDQVLPANYSFPH